MYESKGMAIGAFLGAYLGIFCVVTIVIAVISIIANWKVYTKAGREGWKCLIPVYNVYVLYDMVWETKQFWIYFGLMIGSAVFTALGSNLFVTLVILALNIAILVWSIRLLRKTIEYLLITICIPLNIFSNHSCLAFYKGNCIE